jgi:hypothetical protein
VWRFIKTYQSFSAALKGHLKIDIYNEVFAKLHLGIVGLNIDFVIARICFYGSVEYNLNILQVSYECNAFIRDHLEVTIMELLTLQYKFEVMGWLLSPSSIRLVLRESAITLSAFSHFLRQNNFR